MTTIMTNYSDPANWYAPAEDINYLRWLGRYDEATALELRVVERVREAEAMLGGRPVRARYWLNSGWFISANPYAVPPMRLGDKDFAHFLSARVLYSRWPTDEEVTAAKDRERIRRAIHLGNVLARLAYTRLDRR